MSTKVGRPVIPKIRVPEEGLGPAMQAINPAQRAYVIARVFEGLTQARAAEAAGYSASTPDTAKVAGYRLEHDERIQAAIAEECRKLMRSEGANSVRAIIRVRDNPKAKHSDVVKAAEALLDRCGLGAVSQHHHLVEHRLTEEQQDRKILALAAELGLDKQSAQKLLIDPSKVIVDAEFTEVSPAEPPTPEELAAAAERERENARRRELGALPPEQREAAKAELRAKRTAEQKAKRAASDAARSSQVDLEEYLAADGSEGLEDLLIPRKDVP
jgi:DNA-directed RNA polymerase specialized sigma24 family protein